MPTEHKLLTKAYFFVSLHLQSASQTGSHPTTAPRKPIVAAHQPQQSVYQSQLSANQPKVAIIFVTSRQARETYGNHKGWVSKTTSKASIGACMAQMGKKVLLIDLDGQANLTLYFIPNEDDLETCILDALVDGAPWPVKHIRDSSSTLKSER